MLTWIGRTFQEHLDVLVQDKVKQTTRDSNNAHSLLEEFSHFDREETMLSHDDIFIVTADDEYKGSKIDTGVLHNGAVLHGDGKVCQESSPTPGGHAGGTKEYQLEADDC